MSRSAASQDRRVPCRLVDGLERLQLPCTVVAGIYRAIIGAVPSAFLCGVDRGPEPTLRSDASRYGSRRSGIPA